MSRDVTVEDIGALAGRTGALTVGDIRVPVIVAVVRTDPGGGPVAAEVDLILSGRPTRVTDEGSTR